MTYDYHGCYWGFRLLHNDHYFLNFHNLNSDRNHLYRNTLCCSYHHRELHNNTTNHRIHWHRHHCLYNTIVYLLRSRQLPIHSSSMKTSIRRHDVRHRLHRKYQSLPSNTLILQYYLLLMRHLSPHLRKLSYFRLNQKSQRKS